MVGNLHENVQKSIENFYFNLRNCLLKCVGHWTTVHVFWVWSKRREDSLIWPKQGHATEHSMVSRIFLNRGPWGKGLKASVSSPTLYHLTPSGSILALYSQPWSLFSCCVLSKIPLSTTEISSFVIFLVTIHKEIIHRRNIPD